MKPISDKRRAKLAEQGIKFPSTFTPNPPKLAASHQVKRQRDTGPTRSERAKVRARSGGVCEYPHCGHAATQIHHRRPRRMGGSRGLVVNLPSNLVDLCDWHHRDVEYHRAGSIAKGLLLPASQDPARVPVWTRHDPGPILLTSDGGWIRYEEAAA